MAALRNLNADEVCVFCTDLGMIGCRRAPPAHQPKEMEAAPCGGLQAISRVEEDVARMDAVDGYGAPWPWGHCEPLRVYCFGVVHVRRRGAYGAIGGSATRSPTIAPKSARPSDSCRSTVDLMVLKVAPIFASNQAARRCSAPAGPATTSSPYDRTRTS